MYPNFGQELGKKSGEEGTGTNASIETQQFEQKRSQDVALTRTHNPDRLLPLGRGRCSRSPPSRGAQLARLPDGAGQGARPCGCSAGLPTAALRGTRLALCALSDHDRPHTAAEGPSAPRLLPPKAAERSGGGVGAGSSGDTRGSSPAAGRNPLRAGRGWAARPAFPPS